MQAVIESIRYNKDGRFPRNELRELIRRQEEAIPCLLKLLEEALEQPEMHLQDVTRMDHIYALYALAQFREVRMYPLLIQMMSLPSDAANSLLVDVLAEDAGKLLASVYSGDPGPIRRLVENEEVDEYVRGQALTAITSLVLHGQWDREEAVAYFRELLLTSSGEYASFSGILVDALAALHGEEALDAIRLVFEKELVDPMFIGLKDMEEVLRQPKEKVLHSSRTNQMYAFIEDVIGEMEWWACFEQPKRAEASVGGYVNTPVRVEKIGRNEPCPCGSGKKYKKCCGA